MKDKLPPVHVLILGGTAAYWLNVEQHVRVVRRVRVGTPFGEMAPVTLLETPSGLVGYCSRHGEGALQRTARFVNHRANIVGARMLGARWILSWNGVGALRPDWGVGELVLLTDVVDFTRGRIDSLGEATAWARLWPRGSTPFAQEAREALQRALAGQTRTWHTPAIYACSEGPRLETAAEIRLFQEAGADVVGMTLCPEVWLAQEVGIGYGAVGYITNHATGVIPQPQARSGREFGAVVATTCFPIVLEAATYLLDLSESA